MRRTRPCRLNSGMKGSALGNRSRWLHNEANVSAYIIDEVRDMKNARLVVSVTVSCQTGDWRLEFGAKPGTSPLLNPPWTCVHGLTNDDCVTPCILRQELEIEHY